ncbi:MULTISPECIES: GGDEF domain-containing protein [Gammaproteobacteria]|uniref:sensor domain-containing diguanylate cyclase n=1 Tax=Gammaproteobacteria TaxID=1236 RepID=UPI000DCF6AD3|nr:MULTISPECIES: diguanylate cyclase [Gammaproteobacteria]RTE87273.1 diguanylate cyclase [Aliidiomarina sp. B3213]TCZ92940.1 diguanylate cyclase [Lysobacter sp. N42]
MMKLPSRLSFHLTLSLAIALIIVMASIAIVSFKYQKEAMVERATHELMERTENVGFAVQQMLRNREIVLETLASRMSSQGEPEGAEELFTQLSETMTQAAEFDSLWLISSNGQLLQTSNESMRPTESTKELVISYVLPEVIASERFKISEPISLYVSEKRILSFAMPVVVQGAARYVLVGNTEIANSSFFQSLGELSVGGHNEVGLLSPQLNVILHPNYTEFNSVLPASRQMVVASRLGSAEHAASVEQYDGENWLQTYKRLPNSLWVVGVAIPLSDVYKEISSLQMLQLQTGTIAALFAILLISFIVRRRLKVFKRLTYNVERVRSGKAIDLGLTGLDELDVLVGRFNDLLREKESARQELKQQEAYLDLVLSTSSVGHFMANREGRLEYVNETFMTMTGHTREALLKGAFVDGFQEEDKQGIREQWLEALNEEREYEAEVQFLNPDGIVKWFHIQSKPVVDHGICLGHVGTVTDVTERNSKIEDLQSKAYRDELTRILNRRGLEQVMHNSWHDAQLFNKQLVFLALDLDNFKLVNDTFGHEKGDWVLAEVAQTLDNIIRDSDWVGRLGGDEFVVVLPGCPNERAVEIAQQIVDSISQVTSEAGLIEVTVSVGVAQRQLTDQSELDMLRRADKAAYKAKSAGRNQWALADENGD